MKTGTRFLSAIAVIALAGWMAPTEAWQDPTVPYLIATFEGKVESNLPDLSDHWVELSPYSGHLSSYRTQPSRDGSFSFHNVPAGEFQLRLETQNGKILATQTVHVGRHAGRVELRVREQAALRPGEGSVSVNELRHPIPKKAAKAMEQAARLSSDGKREEAVLFLQKALEMHPQYAAAHANLAAQYIRLRRFPEALEQAEAAHVLEPENAGYLTNYAIALFESGQTEEAETAARKAILLHSGHAQAHYLLASILARKEQIAESLRHLELAAPRLPVAHVLAAQVYCRSSKPDAAMKELQTYLATGHKTYRTAVEGWLQKGLRNERACSAK